MNKFKLVCFDIDGTLVDGTSWFLLTEGLGCSLKKHVKIYRAKREKIPFLKKERMLTKMYRESGNATQKFIREFFSKVKPKSGTKEIISYLKKKRYKVYLISGAIDIYVEEIAKKLTVDGFYANSSLKFDKNGVLKKIYYKNDQGEIKLKQLNKLIKKLGINLNKVVFVGDSENDIAIFKEIKHGIAVNSSSEGLRGIAWKNINSLGQLKDIL